MSFHVNLFINPSSIHLQHQLSKSPDLASCYTTPKKPSSIGERHTMFKAIMLKTGINVTNMAQAYLKQLAADLEVDPSEKPSHVH